MQVISGPRAADGRHLPQGNRRQLRREETIEEIVGHAIDIMAVDGVVGLSLGEIARRMGVRTPSLYTYVDSKSALYDELFRRGWEGLGAALAVAVQSLGPVTVDSDVKQRLVLGAERTARWAVANAALAQLMFWRPVPLFTPSDQSYDASLAVSRVTSEEIGAWIRLGLVDDRVDPMMLGQAIATVVTGVVTRKLANEPGSDYDDGPVTPGLPFLLEHLIDPYLVDR